VTGSFVIRGVHTMLLARAAAAAVACALVGCVPIPEIAKVGPPAVVGLKRGINAGNALDAPSEGAWGPALDEAYFDHVAAAGFDHVRIPIRFSVHAATAAPYTIDPTFFARVDWAVDQAQQRGMTAIVDFHYFEELLAEPDANAPRFVGIWKQIAARYRDRPASVILELLNEPTKNMTADKWNTILAQTLAAVRAIDPTRKVIVDSVSWAAAKELPNLVLPAGDPNLIASFHTYQPILFTHQGMSWMTAEYQTLGVIFPGPPPTPVAPVAGALEVDWVAKWFERYNTLPAAQNPSGPATIQEEFEFARAFTERTGLPTYLGEFGVGNGATPASRVTWTRMVRKEAERRGIGWCAWDDSGSIKVFDRATKRWEDEIKDALLK
jgi:endoglucanase